MEPRRRVKRAIVWTGLTVLAGLAAWQAAAALQDTPEASTAPAQQAAEASAETGDAEAVEAPKAKPRAAAPIPGSRLASPMAERVATIGILNKRNGLSRDLVMKPGQAVRMGDLVVRLRACEETDPWEPEKWTGAFVQVITRETKAVWRKTFSGWLYKESPSLNVVEHPIYDVWVKACKMRHAEVGPSTIVARGDESGGASVKRSSADKSPDAEGAAPTPVESAAPSATE
jgi:hypothetical protein